MLDIQAGGWLPLDADLTMSTSRQVENQREHSGSKPSSQNRKKKKIVIEGKLLWFQNLSKQTLVSESHKFRLVGLYAMSTLGMLLHTTTTCGQHNTKQKHKAQTSVGMLPATSREVQGASVVCPWTEAGL